MQEFEIMRMDTALDDEKREEFIKWVQRKNSTVRITDTITVDNSTHDRLASIMHNVDAANASAKSFITHTDINAPSDILWSMTLPTPNIQIHTAMKYNRIDDDGSEDTKKFCDLYESIYVSSLDDVKEATFDVRIYEDVIMMLLDYIHTHTSSEVEAMPPMCVGCICAENYIVEHGYVHMPLYIDPNTQYITAYSQTSIISNNINQTLMNLAKYRSSELAQLLLDSIVETVGGILSVWYTIQLVLLNPMLKVCVNNTGRVPVYSNNAKKNGKKKPVRYMKRIVIDSDKFDDVMNPKNLIIENGDHNKYTRHTLLWHVAGHWYTRNGKKYFRHGHWKGPLAKNLPNDFEPRERELVINETIGK